MKKLIVLLLLLPLLSFTAVQDNSKFIGKWVGEDQKEIGIINFDTDGYAHFIIQGKIFGGKEFVYDGQKGRMTYKINQNTDPIQIDLILTKLETGEQNKMLCIAEFIDIDTMNFAISFNQKRPTNFNSDNAIILRRGK